MMVHGAGGQVVQAGCKPVTGAVGKRCKLVPLV
jgi:hypothetical protein